MNKQEKTLLIQSIAEEMLEEALEAMKKNVAKALNSSAIDVEAWDEKYNFMILPKTIVIAVLENEAKQYVGSNPRVAKEMAKEAKNIKYYI